MFSINHSKILDKYLLLTIIYVTLFLLHVLDIRYKRSKSKEYMTM